MGTQPSSSPAAIEIPTGNPVVQCAVEHGLRIVHVEPPELEGDSPSYEFSSDLPIDQAMTILTECRKKFGQPHKERTLEELRVIFDRWVQERACLVRLGYRPVEPPSFETFAATWKSGPWMPTDGVDTGAWSDTDYREAKIRCSLEMFYRS